MRRDAFDPPEPATRIEACAIAYLASPTVIFVAGWLVSPIGPLAALLLCAALLGLLLPMRHRWHEGPGLLLLPIVAVAGLWVVVAGVGHWVFANQDWIVRDAVLVDLVRDAWPVTYRVDGADLLLRAPIGYFLPAALVGKVWGIAAAEQALLLWTVIGVVLTFGMMLRDRPTLGAALLRMAVFIAFSGMDIVGQYTHYKPYAIGDHLEWWAFLFQYSSQTTQLFWVPNHALPGWLAMAWLLGQDPRRLSTTTACLFVLFAPLWSPLTAVGIAPVVVVAVVRRLAADPVRTALRALLDWRLLLPFIVCVSLVYPYLVAGSGQVASGNNQSVRWVGEDFLPRYVEFCLFEFAGFAVLLLSRRPRDALLWAAVVVLLLLPNYRFGPYNDLAMRGSIAPLTLLAIEMGRWLSTPRIVRREPRRVVVGIVLLAIGAVTPFMEFARAFQEPAWPLDTRHSVVDVTRGTHYLTSPDQSWLRRFMPGDR